MNYLVADHRYLARRGEKEFNLAVVVRTLAELLRSSLAYSVRQLRNRPSSNYSVGMCWSIQPTFMGRSAFFLVVVLRFLACSFGGTLIYAATLSSIGYGVGSNLQGVSHDFSLGEYVIGALVDVAVVTFLARSLWAPRAERS